MTILDAIGLAPPFEWTPTPAGARVPFETGLAAYLAADPGIAALAGQRIYRGRLPERDRQPAGPSLTYFPMTPRRFPNLDGDGGTVRIRVQIAAHGRDAPEAEALEHAALVAANKIPGMGSMGGVPVACAWIADGDRADDPLEGYDSPRADYRFDVFIDYFDPLD